MQSSLCQKYFDGHYILTRTTLKGMKNAGSFSFLLAITMNMPHWRQRLLKYAQWVFPYLRQIKRNISNTCSRQFCFAGIQQPLARKIPSCPQLSPRCSCSRIINSLLYTSTCMGFFSFGIKLPSLSLKETSGCLCRSQDTNNTKQHLAFLKAQAAKTPWKKDHWDRL